MPDDVVHIGHDHFARQQFCKLNMLKALSNAQKDALFTEMIRGTSAYQTDYKEG